MLTILCTWSAAQENNSNHQDSKLSAFLSSNALDYILSNIFTHATKKAQQKSNVITIDAILNAFSVMMFNLLPNINKHNHLSHDNQLIVGDVIRVIQNAIDELNASSTPIDKSLQSKVIKEIIQYLIKVTKYQLSTVSQLYQCIGNISPRPARKSSIASCKETLENKKAKLSTSESRLEKIQVMREIRDLSGDLIDMYLQVSIKRTHDCE